MYADKKTSVGIMHASRVQVYFWGNCRVPRCAKIIRDKQRHTKSSIKKQKTPDGKHSQQKQIKTLKLKKKK